MERDVTLDPAEARVDKWLWSVRVFKTRSLATDACRGGRVKVNGRAAKPATVVRVGDQVVAVAHGVRRELEVARVIDKRVGAPLAAECVREERVVVAGSARAESDYGLPVRVAGTGRPT